MKAPTSVIAFNVLRDDLERSAARVDDERLSQRVIEDLNPLSGADGPARVAADVLVALSASKLVEFSVDLFDDVEDAVAEHVAVRYLGGRERVLTGKPASATEASDDVDAIVWASAGVPFPADLPFPSTMLVPERPIPFQDAGSRLRVGTSHPARRRFPRLQVVLGGFLLTEEPERCWEFGWWFTGDSVDATDGVLDFSARGLYTLPHLGFEHVDGWTAPTTLVPWIVNALVAEVNARRVVRVDTGASYSARREVERLGKRYHLRRATPTPYYRVNLSTRFEFSPPEDRDAVAGSTVTHWSHRWDVRAHERVYVRRGPLPLTVAERAHLLALGYRVAGRGELVADEDVQRACARGHAPRREGEWFAIKSVRVRSSIKGPAEAPYVPSRHVVGAEDDVSV